MTPGRLALLAASLTFALAARAEHPPAPAGDAPLVPLMDNLGSHEHPITTTKPLAQQYFNQGLRLMYAFNHDEAVRAFRAAAKIDPSAAMPYWGTALALGPNYNAAAEEDRIESALAALADAQKRAATASPAEAAYIEALAKRYSDDPDADRKPLDTAYADAMRKVAARYPDDLDAAVLFAESLMDLHPWDLWADDGKPQPGTEEIVAVLERVLKQNPNHPGANHFYIHAVEASPDPGRGLPSALRLPGLVPGAGHMVHMPAHIFVRLGRYGDAAEANRRAIEADRQYIARYKPQGLYPMMYYPHNIHFLWYAASLEGRSAEAIASAGEVTNMLGDDMVKEMPMLEAFVPTRLYALARFRRWDDILNAPAPPAEFTFAKGIWHYSRGLALAATDKLDAAEAEQKALQAILAEMPKDKMAMRHSAADLLGIAAAELSAAIDARRGAFDRAVAALERGVASQDKLQYDEPPAWYVPLRQTLGGTLLSAKRPAEAEKLFREDLRRNPENGWSLAGLEAALRAQNRAADADEVHARFEKAWARADVKPF